MFGKIEFIAKVCHIGWVNYQIGIDQEYNLDILDDQFESLKNGVEFYLTHLDMTFDESHQNWVDMKLNQGWKYGETKDIILKTHPNIIGYDELSIDEKIKDLSFKISCELGLKIWNELND